MRNADDKARRNKDTLIQLRLVQMEEAMVWKKAFGTEDGKECLSLLRKHYYDIDKISHNDPIVTQNRSAQRDLVRYIISQVEFEA